MSIIYLILNSQTLGFKAMQQIAVSLNTLWKLADGRGQKSVQTPSRYT